MRLLLCLDNCCIVLPTHIHMLAEYEQKSFADYTQLIPCVLLLLTQTKNKGESIDSEKGAESPGVYTNQYRLTIGLFMRIITNS